MKKRVLSLLIALCLVVGLVPAVAAEDAASGTWGENITWTLENGLLTLSGEGEIADVRSQWDEDDNYVGTTAPWYGLNVTELVIEEGITNIGLRAFSDIPTLTSVTLPDSLTVIEACAFEECTGLVSINLPESLTEIRFSAFSYCESLTGPLTIPAGVTELEDDVFAYCSALTGVELHDGITRIGINAFSNSGVTSIELPASVTQIDPGAFESCPNLTSIDVAEGNETYFSVDGVLYGHQNWGDKLVTFVLQVPGGYSGVLTIPEGVQRFYDYDSMIGCTEVTEIYLPATIDKVECNHFRSCTKLTAIHVDEANEKFYDIDGILYGSVIDYDENYDEVEYLALIACPPAWSGTSEFHVPAEVECLSVYCFVNCENLKNIYIPAGARSVYSGIFEGCSNLQGIWFEEGHPYFISDSEGVVFNTDRTEEVYDPDTDAWIEAPVPAMTILHYFPTGRTGYYEVPDGTTEIFGDAFCGSSIEAVKFPASLSRLDYWCMDHCLDLSWVLFTGDKPSHGDGCFENVTADVYYPAGNATWDVYEEELDWYIGPDFFASYGNLTYIPYDPADMPVWPGLEPVVNPFTDVPAGSFFEEPVLWAVEKGITNGLSATEFGPTATCNRAQVVTFLWRAAGSPEPTSTENPFVDVAKGSFYEKPVLWAVENSITNGSDATHFNPNGVCNRAQVVTFLYRAFKSPAVSTEGLPFTDVPAGAWYEAPIAWAVEKGITNGLNATEFGPNSNCNRAQVVTFLHRAYTN